MLELKALWLIGVSKKSSSSPCKCDLGIYINWPPNSPCLGGTILQLGNAAERAFVTTVGDARLRKPSCDNDTFPYWTVCNYKQRRNCNNQQQKKDESPTLFGQEGDGITHNVNSAQEMRPNMELGVIATNTECSEDKSECCSRS